MLESLNPSRASVASIELSCSKSLEKYQVVQRFTCLRIVNRMSYSIQVISILAVHAHYVQSHHGHQYSSISDKSYCVLLVRVPCVLLLFVTFIIGVPVVIQPLPPEGQPINIMVIESPYIMRRQALNDKESRRTMDTCKKTKNRYI